METIRLKIMTQTAVLNFEGIAQTLPVEEALRKAYALTSQGYSQILQWGEKTEITIYKESAK
jgi:hypothetical protein